MTERHIACVRVPDQVRDGVTVCQDTKVYVGGVELSGVYRLVLIAEPNSVWRAEISCYVTPTTIPAVEAIIHRHRRTMGEWLRDWWRGSREVTSLTSTATEHVATRPRVGGHQPEPTQGTIHPPPRKP